jgi:NADH dehydrogenase
MNNTNKKPHVIVVGAGFGGLRAARSLASAPVSVTLVDRNNYHLFQPLLYQVATAGISPTEIAHPVRGILRNQKNFEFRMAEVSRIDLETRRLVTSTGEMTYDFLVLAVGGETNYFGLASVEQNSFTLKELDDAIAIRDHLLTQFELANQESDPEKCRALLTFVIVGGGPTGVECAGAISELIRMVLRKDFPKLDFSDVQVILLEAADRVLAYLTPDLSQLSAEVLRRKHVEVRFDSQVADYDGERVLLKSGEILSARTLIWAAGIRAAGLARLTAQEMGLSTGSLGRVKVTPTLQLPGHPEVFVIGDAAYLEDAQGRPLPMVAPVAMQQALVAAKNITRLTQGLELRPFVYKDPGMLATIGRNEAVAEFSGFKFRGFLAWVVWLVVHIWQLIGFRNRLLVLINWAWSYLFYDLGVRIISQKKVATQVDR